MNIQESDNEDIDEIDNAKFNQIIDVSDDSDNEYDFFAKEDRLVANYQEANNLVFVNKSEINFSVNKSLFVKNGYNEGKIDEYYDKIHYMNHAVLKKQFAANTTVKGIMYLRFANKFLK